jgi:putative transposase
MNSQATSTRIQAVTSSRELSAVPPALWEQARARIPVLNVLANEPELTRERVRAAAREIGCGLTWTYELLKRHRKDPRLSSLLPHPRGRKAGGRWLGVEREDVVRIAIEEFYLTRQQPTVSALLQHIRGRCLAQGLPAPSRHAVQRRIGALPAADVLWRRRGRKASRDRYGPVTGSLTAPHPLAVVQIDHTLVDVMLVDSVTRQPIKRPWLTLAIDVHSRCVVGFSLSLNPPSATSVALCIAHAVLPKSAWLSARGIEANWDMAGLPDRLHLDNGREFHSHALTRGCEQYGIELDYRPVRTPHYGGHIERLIGTMMGKVHLLPGTTFSNIAEKGAHDPEGAAVLTLDELERWLALAITGVYHQTVHRVLNTTPVAAWRKATELADATALSRRSPPSDPRRLLIDFLPFVERRVRREGVVLHAIAYWADVLRTWIGRREKVLVRYDPRDLSRLYLLGPDGTYYDLPYRDLYRPAISLWEQQAALRRLRQEGRKEVDESLLFDTIEAMRRLTAHAATETKRLRRHRERARLYHNNSSAEAPVLSAPAPPPGYERKAEADGVFASVEEWS